MLLSTQAGIVVSSDHVAWIALRREVLSPSEPDPPPGTPPTYRVLLGMAAQVDGTYIVAARSLTQEEARFIREDITHTWAEGASRWSANESLQAHRDGAYFAADVHESSKVRRHGTNGTLVSALPDL